MSNNRDKLTVSLDLDDVLVNIMDLYLEELRLVSGLSFTREDVAHYETTRMRTPDGKSPTEEQVVVLIDNLARKGTYASAPPFDESLAMCRRLADMGIAMVINTARRASTGCLQDAIVRDTHAWITRHFPGDFFQDIIFSTHLPGGKLDVCLHHGCAAHVEDAWHHVESMQGQQGLLPILLEAPHNRYAWGQTVECPPAGQMSKLDALLTVTGNPASFPIIRVSSHKLVPDLIKYVFLQ